MARHDKSDFKTINKIERYFICHDTMILLTVQAATVKEQQVKFL